MALRTLGFSWLMLAALALTIASEQLLELLHGHAAGSGLDLFGSSALAMSIMGIPPGRSAPIHTAASIDIRAPANVVFDLYAKWQDWPRLFPLTIKGVRLVREDASSRVLEVQQVEGRVPNVMRVVSPQEISLHEDKRHYHAHFENRFEPAPAGTRYVVVADVTLKGPLRWLRAIAKPIIRARIRRFVLEPIRRAAESGLPAPSSAGQAS